MEVVLDLEANGLNPTKIWVVVCKDISLGTYHVFRRVTDEPAEAKRLLEFLDGCSVVIGHNILGYDFPVVCRLLGAAKETYYPKALDTFIISKLVDYPRDKHSIEDYGEEFNLPKGDFSDWSSYSEEMETYCIRDVEITERVYNKYKAYIHKPEHAKSITLLHRFQVVVSDIETRGFMLDTRKVDNLLDKVFKELHSLDTDILDAFQPRLRPVREITPKATKYGTISLANIPKCLRNSISDFNVDCPFTYCSWVSFNPASHKQILTVLNEAGWRPTDKTKTHIEAEREYNKLLRSRKKTPEVALTLKELYTSLERLKEYGWKVNEENLSTLPPNAPAPARLLAKRILYESRRRTLTEWKSLVRDDGRVHGKFQALGAWTHRMAHQNPNMANITNAVKVSDGSTTLLGKELRQCWVVPKNRLLVGVDAEAIQLRIFAHLINDPELINSIVNGDKKLGTDPHSLNKKYFGEFCKTRNAAKHSLYAIFFGGGAGKIAEIMACEREEALSAIDNLLRRYPGLETLQKEIFPRDARRGWFEGVDGRKVRIPGDTVSKREHLCMSGYLQNGEAVVMEEAVVKSDPQLKELDSFFVNIVHDETQIETPNDFKTALRCAEIVADEIRLAGVSLNLNCPLAGSFRNDHGDYTIGRNWYQTH